MFRNSSSNLIEPQYPRASVLYIFFFSRDLFYQNTVFLTDWEEKGYSFASDSLRSSFLREPLFCVNCPYCMKIIYIQLPTQTTTLAHKFPKVIHIDKFTP